MATFFLLQVREGGKSLVAFGHRVGFLFALDRAALVLGRVKQLERELLRHAFPATLPGETDDPATGEGQATLRPDFNRDLVGRPTHAPGLDLEQWGCVAKGEVENLERLLLGLLARAAQRFVHDLLGSRPL